MSKLKKFGTFGGVFTPSILTILGVIMYLRLPMIIGESGLMATIGIIVIAHIISATTGLSVSSIATDKKVEAGGTYYMISRSLGLPIGGTLGLALFVGLSFSVSLYLIGFSESFLNYFDFEVTKDAIRITGTLILIAVTTITFISTSLAIKTQYFIMAAIILSLISIIFGQHEYQPTEPLISSNSSTVPLMVLFGIFFPAVTGFEAGVSMSGDLQDPKKSIPTGSISAIIVGFVVYIALAFFFSYTVDANLLANDSQVLLKISWIPQLVVAGIWGATLSSALGSILGAPRILQATAVDKISWKIFAKGVGASNEPRNALLLTFAIAEFGILIGELDVIARIVSIFFITTYGFLNLSCAFEAWTSADFRPEFKTPIWVSLLGAVACIIVMIQLDFLAMLGATLILGALFLFLKRRELNLESGDAWSGVWASLVKTGLERLDQTNLHARNWRPNIIMFKGKDEARPHLVEMGQAVAGKLGILTGFELIQSDGEMLAKAKPILTEGATKGRYFNHKHFCKDIYSGIDEVSRLYGFSGVQPNTVLMGWSKQEKNKEKFVSAVKSFELNNYNAIFLHYQPEKKFGAHKTIDIWWSGMGRNLALSINLIRHITSGDQWKSVKIRLLVIANVSFQKDTVFKSIEKILDNYRVDMEIKIINNAVDKLPKPEIILNESGNTDLTVIGIQDKHYQKINETIAEINHLINHLGTTLILHASSSFEEYSLGFEKESNLLNLADSFGQEILVLPELQQSKYPVINNEVKKIDTNGQKVLELLFQKTFVPYFQENARLNKELETVTSALFGLLKKAIAYKDSYRRTRAFYKAKNDFYFRSRKLLESLQNQALEQQREALTNGINWYISRLKSDILRFPKGFNVPFNKEDFMLKKDDPFGLKTLKIRKRAGNPFAKHSINLLISYRQIARYYLQDNRFLFFNAFLEEFDRLSMEYLSGIKKFNNLINDLFDELEKKLSTESGTSILEEKKAAIESLTQNLIENQGKDMKLFQNRLQVEFRKNLQLMVSSMEQLNINTLIQEKRKGKTFYKKLETDITDFPEVWYEEVNNFTNKIFLETVMAGTKSRIKEEMDDYLREMNMLLDNKVIKEIEAVKKTVKKSSNESLPELKLDFESESINLLHGFAEKQEEIGKLIQSLPESITIASPSISEHTSLTGQKSENQMDEVANIPAARITNHFMESRFFGPTQDYFEDVNESIKNKMLGIKDHLSLMRFNMENIDAENDDVGKTNGDIKERTLQKIQSEENELKEIKSVLHQKIQENIESAFQPLTSYTIVESAGEFVQFLRDYQSKRVLSKFGAFREEIKETIRNFSAKLLYSRSGGILLAKKLIEDEQLRPLNGKILDLVEVVSPDAEVLANLPHYYKNLFSGRSSISDDFWISRKKEEELLKKSFNRLQRGVPGGVLLLGERNSGKTAFCRHISTKLFKKEKTFHIFPPKSGSVHSKDFVNTIQEVTQIDGPLELILNRVPAGSAFIIHDMEMWWERQQEGLEVVLLVKQLIYDYGHKFFFLVNMNPFTFELLNQLCTFQESFTEVMRFTPFDAESLKNLVISRHQSSGIKFSLNEKSEEDISEIKMANLFNKFFNYSQGNPGVALNTWISAIEKVYLNTIEIVPPESPEIDVLDKMKPEWLIILENFILHKRLTYPKLRRILGIPQEEIKDLIENIKRTGLVEENKSEILIINPYVEFLIIKILKQKGII
ncbi:amino acid permease [Flexithrix dorotheae]|uniref:amino acid permease n=1 Tax=Flexithrix dorotheae TaxID=70993 RepID=UPI000370B6C0|nr:amino acid permease [Flexithrix dorotheae]